MVQNANKSRREWHLMQVGIGYRAKDDFGLVTSRCVRFPVAIRLRGLENVPKEIDRHGLAVIVGSPVGWETHLSLVDIVLVFPRPNPGLARIGIVLIRTVVYNQNQLD